MSEFEGMNTSAASTETDSSEKIRGRIPKSAWGYVRGQYEIAGLTYEEIGQEFNCTPSAVFYVVKQATLREIAPTLERPEPSLEDGDLLLCIDACSVCGTDLRTYRHGDHKIKPPRPSSRKTPSRKP